jgi:hypothetical protein
VEHGPQFPAGANAELGKHVSEVPLDRARAEEELRTDLRVCQPFRCEPRDLRLLCGQIAASVISALPGCLPGCGEFPSRAIGETGHSYLTEQFVRCPKLPPRIKPAALSSQPFAEDEMSPREIGASAGLTETLGCLAIPALGDGWILLEERGRASLEPEGPGLDAGANSRNTPVSSSFPGRMDWSTNTPKQDRLDGWIVQFGGNAGATSDKAPEKVKVWALCVPGANIPVKQTFQQVG